MNRSTPFRTCMVAVGCAVVLVSAACGSRRAGPGASAAPEIDPAAFRPPPVHSLIGHRDRLELTSEQITRLDSIGRWLEAERSVGRATLPEGGRRVFGPGSRGPSPEEVAALDSVADLHRAAAAAVEATLTERQRELVCEQRAAQAAAADRTGGEGRRLYGPGARGGAGQVRIGGPYAWPWCRSDDPASPGDPAQPDPDSANPGASDPDQ